MPRSPQRKVTEAGTGFGSFSRAEFDATFGSRDSQHIKVRELILPDSLAELYDSLKHSACREQPERGFVVINGVENWSAAEGAAQRPAPLTPLEPGQVNVTVDSYRVFLNNGMKLPEDWPPWRGNSDDDGIRILMEINDEVFNLSSDEETE
jgi:hypothetical protein